MAFPTIPYKTDLTPVPGIIVDVSEGGTLRGQDLGHEDRVDITASWIGVSSAQVAVMRADWAASRGSSVTVNGNDGETYTCLWAVEIKFVPNGQMFDGSVTLRGTRN